MCSADSSESNSSCSMSMCACVQSVCDPDIDTKILFFDVIACDLKSMFDLLMILSVTQFNPAVQHMGVCVCVCVWNCVRTAVIWASCPSRPP